MPAFSGRLNSETVNRPGFSSTIAFIQAATVASALQKKREKALRSGSRVRLKVGDAGPRPVPGRSVQSRRWTRGMATAPNQCLRAAGEGPPAVRDVRRLCRLTQL